MKKFKIIFILGIISFFGGIVNVHAGSLSVYANYSTIYNGNSVVVTVNASGLVGRFSVVSSNTAVLSGGNSAVWLEDQTQTFTFTAKSTGTATITVTPVNVADSTTSAIYSTVKTVTIKVINRVVVVLSSNNNLASLGVDGYTIDPTFNKDTLEYSLTVDNLIEKINIAATAADSTASITGAGERAISEGENKLEVNVTAQNGSVKTYVINVTVKELNPIKVEVDDDDYTLIKKASLITCPSTYTATTIKIDDNEIPAFTSEITGYTLVGLKDTDGNIALYIYDEKEETYTKYIETKFGQVTLFMLDYDKSLIPDNYKLYNMTINDEKREVYKLDSDSDYALLYGMNIETGKVNLYSYNLVENTLQIYNTEEVQLLADNITLYKKIIIGLGSAVLLFFLIIIRLAFRKGKSKEEKKRLKEEKKQIKLDNRESAKQAKLDKKQEQEEDRLFREQEQIKLKKLKRNKKQKKQKKNEE